MTDECTERCRTTCVPSPRSAKQATRFPLLAPLVRNQVRLPPHAWAARYAACPSGVGALGERGDVELENALAEEVDQARLGVRGRLVAGDAEAHHVGVGIPRQCIGVGSAGLVEAGQVGGEGVMWSHHPRIDEPSMKE